MIDFYRVATFEDLGQVAGQSYACHLRSMPLGIISPPPRLDGMEVTGVKGRRKQSMPAIDTRIEQTHVRCLLGVLSESCSCKEIVKPSTLLVAFQRIKELCRLFRPPQFGDAVQRDHGTLHLSEGCPDQQDSTLRKSRFSLCHLHSLGLGSLSETIRGQNLIRPKVRWSALPR